MAEKKESVSNVKDEPKGVKDEPKGKKEPEVPTTEAALNVKAEPKGKKEPEVPPTEAAEEPKGVHPVKVVKKYMLWSMGAGLIPVPMADLGVIAGVQLKMLHHLSKHYGVEFKKNAGKSIIAVLTGSLTADTLRRSFLTSFIKSIPVVGALGVLSMPLYAGAITYAIGKIFIRHFESGGTFLDFDSQKVKDYFVKLYQEGQTVAADLKPEPAK